MKLSVQTKAQIVAALLIQVDELRRDLVALKSRRENLEIYLAAAALVTDCGAEIKEIYQVVSQIGATQRALDKAIAAWREFNDQLSK